MSGNKLGAIKTKTGFGKKGYKPGAMITKMNASKMTAGSASGVGRMQKTSLSSKIKGIKKSGTFKGKSNVLGHGGRAAQLKAKGVPGGVIGMLARKAGAAKGQRNYHGK